MLRALSIRDVVLIDRLDLAFAPGMSALTGETGAGKSILLDALGLAIGARAEARLVRHGAPQASVTAEFDVSETHIPALLSEHGIEAADGVLLLRRVIGQDGRSRAFANDQPVSVALLRGIAEALIEVHGEFENQRLLDPVSHRALLDAFGGLGERVREVGQLHAGWRSAKSAVAEAERALESARRDEAYVRHAVEELARLDPREAEEAALAERRSLFMNREKLVTALTQAAQELEGGKGVEASLRSALRLLERSADKAGGRLNQAIAALSRAASETADGVALLAKAESELEQDSDQLERVEERLFALRAAARKHNTTVDSLPGVLATLKSTLATVDDGAAALKRLRREEAQARTAYAEASERLGRDRRTAAKAMSVAVQGELAPLKLEKATFGVRVDRLEEGDWGPQGADRVMFEVATNPGAPAGPLNKIASAGELSRFMLALKVVLAKTDLIPTLVFDEVDTGIGGATAAAVGDRLAKLGDRVQVLVVTHSPQVAAVATHHWRVSKSEARGGSVTAVDVLSSDARQEEIARMLAGAKVTDEARAAAGSLLVGGRRKRARS